MVNIIVFIIIGMVLATVILETNGWLVGLFIGWAFGLINLLFARVEKLQREIQALTLEKASASVSAASSSADLESSAVIPAVILPDIADDTTWPVNSSEIHAGKKVMAEPLADVVLSGQQAVFQENTPKVMQPDSDNAAVVESFTANKSSFITKAVRLASDFFSKGNPIVRIGMLVMFLGLAFLVKYASGQGLFPIELRLSFVAIVAAALLLLGWLTRARAGGYGLVLQGGGVAALYLIIYGAFKVYTLLPASLAFVLMLIVVLLGVVLAVAQSAQVLAVMAAGGGFLVPILTSDGSGSYVTLLSYYLLLNLGILAVAWFKSWRLLNWIGFVFTFGIVGIWAAVDYQRSFYQTTQLFIITYFLLYLALSVVFSCKQIPRLTGVVDGTLVFGLPVAVFGLQAVLLGHTAYGLAISTACLSITYFILSVLFWKKYRSTHQLLMESFSVLGVALATLTIPLAFGSQLTSAAWALEAVALMWLGLRQDKVLSRIASIGLYGLASVSLVIHMAQASIHAGNLPIINGDFISLFIMLASALIIGWLVSSSVIATSVERNIIRAIMLIGWCWWLLAGYLEAENHLPASYLFFTYCLFVSVSTYILLKLSQRVGWKEVSFIGYWLLPVIIMWVPFFISEFVLGIENFRLFKGLIWLGLLLFLAVQYYFLFLERDKNKLLLVNIYHVLTAWFIAALIALEFFNLQQGMQWWGNDGLLLWFFYFALPIVFLSFLQSSSRWPIAQHANVYKLLIPVPCVIGLCVWFAMASAYVQQYGSIYLPILNPLDFTQLMAIAIVSYGFYKGLLGANQFLKLHESFILLGGVSFVWINLVMLRALHIYTGVDYEREAMWHSAVVQMSLSILWAVCALLIMNFSRRWQHRGLWITGAVLLAVVVVKLFAVDLTITGTLARIVSFMAVGGLMLLIGYLSPLPSKKVHA